MKQSLVNMYRPVTNLEHRIPEIHSAMTDFGVRASRLWKKMLDKQPILGLSEFKVFLQRIDAVPDQSEIAGLVAHLKANMSPSTEERTTTPTLPYFERQPMTGRTVFALGHSSLVLQERAAAKILAEEYFGVESTGERNYWPNASDFDHVWFIKTEDALQTMAIRDMLRDRPSLLPEELTLNPVVIETVTPQ